jgi:hypothetical protein
VLLRLRLLLLLQFACSSCWLAGWVAGWVGGDIRLVLNTDTHHHASQSLDFTTKLPWLDVSR